MDGGMMRKYAVVAAALLLAATSAQAGKATFHTLDNGMQVILKENHAVPLVSSVVVVKAGSKFENDQNNGFTHLLEHMLFNGTETKTREDINEGIKDYGGYINAFTRQEMTGYLVVMPTEFIEQGLDIQSDQLFNSILPAEEFPKERDIVVEEIKKDSDNESYVANDYFNSVVYAGTPFARPVIGYESTIRSVTRDEVMAYYKKYYVPNNMIAFITGDFESGPMLELVKKYYGAVTAGEQPVLEEFEISPPYGTEVHIKEFPSRVTYINISLPGPLYSDPDYYAFDVLSQMLDSETSSLKDSLTGGEAPLATDVSVSLDIQKEYTMMNISLRTSDPAKVEPAVGKAIEVLSGLPETEFTADDVRRVVVPNKVYEIKLEEKLHYYGIMKAAYIATAGFEFLEGYIDNLSKVVPADVNAVADRYFSEPKYVASALTSSKGAGK
jgi:predicted Zn-dependent peptidase